MIWLAFGFAALWVSVALGAAWMLTTGLAPEGSRRARIAKPLAQSGIAVFGVGAALLVMATRDGRDQRRQRKAIEAQMKANAEADEQTDAIVDEGEMERRNLVEDLLAEADAIEAESEADVSLIRADAEGRTPEESVAAWRALNEGRD